MKRGPVQSRPDITGLFSEWDIRHNTRFGRKLIRKARDQLGLRAPFTLAQVYRMLARCHALAGAREARPLVPRTYRQVYKRKTLGVLR